MNIALFHNRYRIPGGEDRTVEFEHALLEAAGHRVSRYEVSNEQVFARPGLAAIRSTVSAGMRCRISAADADLLEMRWPLIRTFSVAWPSPRLSSWSRESLRRKPGMRSTMSRALSGAYCAKSPGV